MNLEDSREVNLGKKNQNVNRNGNPEVTVDKNPKENREVSLEVNPDENREVTAKVNPEVNMEENPKVPVEINTEENREVTVEVNPDEDREVNVKNREVIVELNPDEVTLEVNPDEVTVEGNPDENREAIVEENADVNASNSESHDKKSKVNYKWRARRIDKISKIIFPVSYLVFNIVFWSVYSSK